MVREPDGSVKDNAIGVCALQCWRRRGAGGDDSAPDHVTWAGLPVNLDFAFSREKCDQVYRQHLTRKRLAQPWRWLRGDAQPCVCEMTAGRQDLDPVANRWPF
jgi:hypothetical protein